MTVRPGAFPPAWPDRRRVSAPAPFIWWLGRGAEAARLAPLVAAVINRRSHRHLRELWMPRLEAFLLWDTLVAAVLLGMAMSGIRNLWLHDLTFFPGVLLAAWTLCGLRPSGGLARALAPAGVIILALAAWDAALGGLAAKWTMAMAGVSATLLAATLWELVQLLLRDEEVPLRAQPAFWLLSAWVLHHGMMLIFYPLSKYFLRTLSREWILYPWLVTYLLGALFNLVLAKTFLCPKPRSS